MKKLLNEFYITFLNIMLDSQQETIRYECIFGYPETIHHKTLQLREAYFKFVFEFYKSLLPKKWVYEFEKELA